MTVFQETDSQMAGDDLTRRKIVVRLRLSHDDYSTDPDEKDARVLATRLDAVLTEDGRAEINGMEFMAGWIDILIFGRETDDDTDAIYSKLVPVFLAHPCVKGSHIVREYGELGEGTRISDTIA